MLVGRVWTRREYLLAPAMAIAASLASAQGSGPKDFNAYVLKAVDTIASSEYFGKGYDSKAFTHALPFGKADPLAAQDPPYTMCVAAQLEVVLTALDIYAKETGDYSAYEFLPKASWQRLRPTDLRGQVWVVRYAASYGTADAFANFGMGEHVPFEKLKPGSFVNLNRTNKTGHAVTFLGYLDATGSNLDVYSSKVAGFKYFSSQGTKDSGGFGYRYAFFGANCPTLEDGKRRDCKVIRSTSQKMLNTGILWSPVSWDKAKAKLQLDRAAVFSRSGEEKMIRDGQFNDKFFNGRTTDD